MAGIIGIERRWQSLLVVNGSRDNITHTGAAITIATSIGQYNALAQRGIENGLGRLDAKGMAAGLYGDLIGHIIN